MGPEANLNTHGQLNVPISGQPLNRWDFRQSPGTRSRVRAPSCCSTQKGGLLPRCYQNTPHDDDLGRHLASLDRCGLLGWVGLGILCT